MLPARVTMVTYFWEASGPEEPTALWMFVSPTWSSQASSKEMTLFMLTDVQICQCLFEHCHYQSYSHLLVCKLDPYEQNQHQIHAI
jgi:hypothetical protein